MYGNLSGSCSFGKHLWPFKRCCLHLGQQCLSGEFTQETLYPLLHFVAALVHSTLAQLTFISSFNIPN